MVLISGTRLGPYEIVAPIGAGGMGEVYRARDTKLNREVAIKVLPESFAADADRVARFMREAKTLASLNHPNIAAIYGIEEQGPTRALVMELVEGEDLSQIIAGSGLKAQGSGTNPVGSGLKAQGSGAPTSGQPKPLAMSHEPSGGLPLDEALPIARQIADALEAAHEQGIIHRDLKPANIKVRPDGTVKVLDFGLAKAIDPIQGSGLKGAASMSPTLTTPAQMTGIGAILGTAAYMAPEQARGKAVDKRADIWAFGVVLYEVLAGRLLFGGGETVSDAIAAVITRDPDWSALPTDTPPHVRRLLERCLRKDPKQRIRDMGDVRLALDEPDVATSVSTAVPRTRRGGGYWWALAASIVAVAGAIGSAIHLLETPPSHAIVRFQIPAPDKSDPAGAGMALSPDGTRLAFVSTGPSGQPMVWVRPLDTLDARALAGTEGAYLQPFWSPDGRSLAFSAGAVLKKVDAAGGPPQTLCEIPGTIVGGSWNRNGDILIGYATGGLYRVSQAGGAPVKVTEPDSSHGEFGHIRPWFLPDGRHFLYFARGELRSDAAPIFVGTLDGPERRRLVSSRQAAAYAPPLPGDKNGHLLFLSEGTLMTQPMDPQRYELAGDPVPVAEHVGSAGALGWFTASANGVLAYRAAGGDASYATQLAWFNRAGNALGTLGPLANYVGSFALSPDGRGVAVEQADATGNHDIWTIDVSRGTPTRFTFDAAVDMQPVWSPDGSRITFASDREHASSFDLYQKASSGAGKEERILQGGSGALRPTSWSRDGTHLLYNLIAPNHGYDVWVMPWPVSNGKPSPLLESPFNEMNGQFSPDGRWVAYSSDESARGQNQVYVQSFPLGSGKFQISTGTGGSQPRWRRDGKELFYVAADGQLMAVDVRTGAQFEFGAPRALFPTHLRAQEGTASIYRYDVAPDGQRFLMNVLPTAGSAVSAVAPITVVMNWTAGARQ